MEISGYGNNGIGVVDQLVMVEVVFFLGNPNGGIFDGLVERFLAFFGIFADVFQQFRVAGNPSYALPDFLLDLEREQDFVGLVFVKWLARLDAVHLGMEHLVHRGGTQKGLSLQGGHPRAVLADVLGDLGVRDATVLGRQRFGIQFGLFVIVYIYYAVLGMAPTPNWYFLLFPLLVVMLAGLALGFGIIISSTTLE